MNPGEWNRKATMKINTLVAISLIHSLAIILLAIAILVKR